MADESGKTVREQLDEQKDLTGRLIRELQELEEKVKSEAYAWDGETLSAVEFLDKLGIVVPQYRYRVDVTWDVQYELAHRQASDSDVWIQAVFDWRSFANAAGRQISHPDFFDEDITATDVTLMRGELRDVLNVTGQPMTFTARFSGELLITLRSGVERTYTIDEDFFGDSAGIHEPDFPTHHWTPLQLNLQGFDLSFSNVRVQP